MQLHNMLVDCCIRMFIRKSIATIYLCQVSPSWYQYNNLCYTGIFTCHTTAMIYILKAKHYSHFSIEIESYDLFACNPLIYQLQIKLLYNSVPKLAPSPLYTQLSINELSIISHSFICV